MPLDQFIKEDRGEKLIDFQPIPSHSFLTRKSRGGDFESRYHENLLQVTNKNEAFLYDLDNADENPKEVE